MKSDKKWWIFIGIIIVIIIALLIWSGSRKRTSSENDVGTDNQKEFVKVQEDGVKVNTSSKLSETKKIEGLEISNIKLTEKENVVEILADIKNTTNKDVEGFNTTMTFLDKDGQTIVIVNGYIPMVEANGTATLNTNTGGNFADAYDFKIERSQQQQ